MKISNHFLEASHLNEGVRAAARHLFASYGWVLILMGVYYVLATWLWEVAYLPAESYRQPIVALELIRRPAVLLLFVAGIISLFALARVRVLHSWLALEYGKELRIFIGLIVVITAWVFSTYDYNLYFDRTHSFDRALLIGLALLVVWRPVFVLPFTAILYMMVAQFDHPLTRQYPWTEMNMVLRILALFGAAFLLYAFTGRRRMSDFFFVLLCLIATFYWGSGLGKLQMSWISHRQLHLLLLGAYSNGWLSFLPSGTIVSIVKFISAFTLPMMIFTLVVESGALLILLRRTVSLLLLLGFIAFHLGVFLISGMFFWKWILLEIALIIILFFRKQTANLPFFKPGYFLLSLLLIGFGGYWFRPTNLSWFDTRLSYTYQLEGIGESGTPYPLPIQSFSPYSDMLTLGNFGYLDPNPQLTNIWGISQNRQIASTLIDIRTPAEVEALEREKKRVLFDQDRSELFDNFIRTYMRNLNQRGTKFTSWSLFGAPAHLWSFPRTPVFTGQEPVSRVIVYRVTWLYDEDQYSSFRKESIREIVIPSGNR